MQKNVDLKPYQNIYFTTMVYGQIKPVFSNKTPLILKEEDGYSILLVTGIASTIGINKQVNKYSKELVKLEFGDHHHYTAENIKTIEEEFNKITSKNKILLTTEKDSVRLKDMDGISEELKNAFYYLPIEIKFLGKQGKIFNQKISNYVSENKSNSELHKRKKQNKS